MMEKSHPDTPVRSFMDDPDIEWRTIKPDYSQVDRKYLAERTRCHAVDSLEKLVENLVKTWEMESTHKTNPKDWCTIHHGKYRFTCNGGRKKDLADNIENGNYKMMMDESPLFDAKNETNDSSHALFKQAFPDGFSWELLDLYSGPPKVAFSWRHWGHWTGAYRHQEPNGEMIEVFGTCVAEVDDQLKIVDLKVFFDPNSMLAKLMGMAPGQCQAFRNAKCKL